MKLTLAELRKRVGDDEGAAYALLEQLRWPTMAKLEAGGYEGVDCPHCGATKAYFLASKDEAGRATGPKRTRTARRVWKCAKCRRQFSVLTGTIFHGTKVPLQDWLTVMVLMSSSKNGIAAREVERLIGVTAETAWFMMHRLREAMRRESVLAPFEGVVIADETFIGGIQANKSNAERKRVQRVHPGKRSTGPTAGKTAVLSLIDADTGEVRSKVVPDVTGATLRKAIADQVNMARTELHTDEGSGYKTFARELAAHRTVNHSEDEYVRYEAGGIVTTNRAEGYFSQLKRSLDGTHHHVSREHLQRYLDEFDFRYSTRKLSDAQRLQRLIDNTDGRRLTYKRITEAS